MKILYLDNAATSWPKPKSVLESMRLFFIKGGGNPGRSGHGRSIGAARIVVQTRELLARLLNVRDSSKIVFTKNATEALNIAIYGLAGEGGHIVTSSMEHNSVMRPLTHLQNHGREVTVVEANAAGTVNPDDVARALRENTCLVVLTHASNVTGAVNDIAGIGRICRDRGVPLLIDAAQTAGCVPIDVEAMCIDFLAFSGHKGLLGPQVRGASISEVNGSASHSCVEGREVSPTGRSSPTFFLTVLRVGPSTSSASQGWGQVWSMC